MRLLISVAVVHGGLALACGGARPAANVAPPPVTPAPAARASGEPSAAPAAPVSPDAGPAGVPATAPGRSCGALGCRAFASPREAFEQALQGVPRVIAVGESHAQKAGAQVPSATQRFREQLLPVLAGRAKGIVVELLLPDKRCQKQQVADVAKRQEAVTAPQAETNQNEFVVLGQAAKALGIVPQPLVPTCDELKTVLGAGSGDIDAMLRLVADITTRETSALLAAGDPEKSVVTYGGLVHNDLAPRPGREAWSFGPRLAERAGESFVEIDLIVPEFVRPEPPWTNLAWYPHYDAARDGAETRLFEPTPRSFVLVFPRTPNENAPP
ncbi:MAG TPA: hypothetical protein VGK73_31125 [Polyangiaceae bacterium]